MGRVEYEIIKPLGVLSKKESGWAKELNLISWNKAQPKFDIREWSPGHQQMGKGTTLNEEEAKALLELLKAEL